MMMLGRKYSSASGYRYGFNSKEKDNDIYGESNAYDFGARIYDPRLGRWLSIDPLASKFPEWSPYIFSYDNPIAFIDPDGMEAKPADDKPRKPLNTTDLIAWGFKNKVVTQSCGACKLDAKNLGNIFETAVIKSLGHKQNYTEQFSGKSRTKKVKPDAVNGSMGIVYDQNGKPKDMYKFEQASFVEVKFKSNIVNADSWNADQINTMIDALADMKGGTKNGKYDASLKPSELGMANLTLVTPANTLIDAGIIEYATQRNVQLFHRTVEQSTENPDEIRVASGVKMLNVVSSTIGLGGTVPTTLIRRAGNDAELKKPFSIF